MSYFLSSSSESEWEFVKYPQTITQTPQTIPQTPLPLIKQDDSIFKRDGSLAIGDTLTGNGVGALDAGTESKICPETGEPYQKKSRAWGIAFGYGAKSKIGDRTLIRCLVQGCGKVYTTQNSSTSSFNYHLINVHGFKRQEVQSNLSSILGIDLAELEPPPEVNFVDYFHQAVEGFIVDNQLPHSLIQKKSFRRVVALAYLAQTSESLGVLSRSTLVSNLHSNFTRAQDLLRECLRESESISLTMDLWTSPSHMGFMGVAAHFISKEWEPKTIVLGLEYIQGSHTAKALATELMRLIKFYQIESKISTITTDSAHGMKDIGNELSLLFEAETEYRFHPNSCHIFCFARTLNSAVLDAIQLGLKSRAWLVDRDGLTVLESQPNIADEPANTLLNKLRASLIFIRGSAPRIGLFASQFTNGNPAMLPVLDVHTRWNSTLEMLEGVLSVYEQINATVTNFGELQYAIFPEDIPAIQSIIRFFQPFEECHQRIASDSNPTMSLGLFYYSVLFETIGETPNDSTFIKAAKAIARERLACSFDIAQANPTYKCAAVMDPRVKYTFWNRNVYPNPILAGSPKEVIDIWQAEFKKVTNRTPPPPRSAFAFVNSSGQNDGDELLKYSSQPVVETSGEEEDARSIFVHWKSISQEFPQLEKMAKRYLAVPMTALSSEKLFARAKLALPNDRVRLAKKSYRETVLLRNWSKKFNH